MYEHEEKKQVDYSGVVIAVILAPVLLLFIHFGKGELGRAVVIVLFCIILAIKMRWDLRRHLWFWGIVVLLSVLHIPLLLYVTWPSGWVPALVATPIALADILIILGAVGFVEKVLLKTSPPDDET